MFLNVGSIFVCAVISDLYFFLSSDFLKNYWEIKISTIYLKSCTVNVSAMARLGELAITGAVLYFSDFTQFFNHDKSSSISLLIKGKSKDLQKLLKYSNETTTSAFNVLLLICVFPIIFVLYSKDLLVIILLLFIL